MITEFYRKPKYIPLPFFSLTNLPIDHHRRVLKPLGLQFRELAGNQSDSIVIILCG